MAAQYVDKTAHPSPSQQIQLILGAVQRHIISKQVVDNSH